MFRCIYKTSKKLISYLLVAGHRSPTVPGETLRSGRKRKRPLGAINIRICPDGRAGEIGGSTTRSGVKAVR